MPVDNNKHQRIDDVSTDQNHPSSCSQSSDHPSKDVSPERSVREKCRPSLRLFLETPYDK